MSEGKFLNSGALLKHSDFFCDKYFNTGGVCNEKAVCNINLYIYAVVFFYTGLCRQ